jgi:ABC-type nitrate/sulfonate/bicarbonate transport system ATPase subunit
MHALPPALELNHVSATYVERNRRLPVLADLSLDVAAGEFVAIIGPSGSGKSTLLDCIAGLIEPDSGSIALAGQTLLASDRLGRSAYLHQHDLLMPWRTIAANAAVGLEARGMPAREAQAIARSRLTHLGLGEFTDAYPAQLSGGMRQRVAFVRTILTDARLLLLDEPFGALDALTRSDMHRWLQEILPAGDRTTLLVTHDVEEALMLADRVVTVSPRPATVTAIETVPFERPRRRALALAPEFLALRARILIQLGGGVPA